MSVNSKGECAYATEQHILQAYKLGELEQDGKIFAVVTEHHLTFLFLWLVANWNFVKLIDSKSFIPICQEVRSYSEGEGMIT